MTFPSKEYFSVTEVAFRWQRKVKDVEYATQVHINRLELKIDDLRQLIWEQLYNKSSEKS